MYESKALGVVTEAWIVIFRAVNHVFCESDWSILTDLLTYPRGLHLHECTNRCGAFDIYV